MFFYLLIPLLLALAVVVCGRLLIDRLRNDLPAFERGRFRRAEHRLLRIFTDLLQAEDAAKMKGQIDYFIKKGKYWRFVGENCNGVELYEDEGMAIEESLRLGLKKDHMLASIGFELRGNAHEIRFGVTDGRLDRWTVQPPLPERMGIARLKVTSAVLHAYPHPTVAEKEVKVQGQTTLSVQQQPPVVSRRS